MTNPDPIVPVPPAPTPRKRKPAKVHVYRDRKGNIRWRLNAKNGAITSGPQESFDSKRNAVNNVKAVQKAFIDAEIVIDPSV